MLMRSIVPGEPGDGGRILEAVNQLIAERNQRVMEEKEGLDAIERSEACFGPEGGEEQGREKERINLEVEAGAGINLDSPPPGKVVVTQEEFREVCRKEWLCSVCGKSDSAFVKQDGRWICSRPECKTAAEIGVDRIVEEDPLREPMRETLREFLKDPRHAHPNPEVNPYKVAENKALDRIMALVREDRDHAQQILDGAEDKKEIWKGRAEKAESKAEALENMLEQAEARVKELEAMIQAGYGIEAYLARRGRDLMVGG